MDVLARNIEEAQKTIESLISLREPIDRATRLVLGCLLKGHKLLLAGNGGSAADASHMATEFVARFVHDRRPYPALSLTDGGSAMTAVSNDYHFDQVFARQVAAFGQKGDVVILFSTSGRSPNVIRALEESRRRGFDSIAFLGKEGGLAKGIATVDLLVPAQVTARIQEAHKFLIHTICERVEEELPREW